MYDRGLIEAQAKSLAGPKCSCFDAEVTQVEPIIRWRMGCAYGGDALWRAKETARAGSVSTG